MRRILLLPFVFALPFFSIAQNSCRSAEYRQQVISADPRLLSKVAAIEAFTQDLHATARTESNGNDNLSGKAPFQVTIPVIVHVLYNGSGQNISDAQIKSQIDILNKDYGRQNADTLKTPVVFRQFASATGFKFELAKIDTNGYATSGIVRKRTAVSGFSIDDKIKFSALGGDDAWDRNRYLNIWVGNLNSGVLGYSSVVGGPSANDGVVIAFTAFGMGGTAMAPYNKGRTATHEIGHWLNLIHTWGDAACGDDHVADTPPQSAADRGCPDGVVVTCANAPNGNMYSNYMDFTNDECMNLFTNGQAERMQALFAPGGERFAMLSSNALTASTVLSPDSVTAETAIPAQRISVYPNPSTNIIYVQFSDASSIGSDMMIYNQVGRPVLSLKITSQLQQVNISSFGNGIYYLKAPGGNTVKVVKLQ